MPAIVINEKQFYDRLERLFQIWKTSEAWQGFDAIEVTNAKYIDTAPETLRGDVFHIWILGYQFVDTIMLYTKQNNTLYMLLSKKKIEMLQKVANDKRNGEKVTLKLIEIQENTTPQFEELIKHAKQNNTKNLAILLGEKMYAMGKLVPAWRKALDAASDIKQVDFQGAIEECFAIKDEQELKNVKLSAKFVSTLLSKEFRKHMEDTINEDSKITHSVLSKKVEDVITAPESSKHLSKYKASSSEVAFTPVVQSGGNYSLTAHYDGAQTGIENSLQFDTIVCVLGTKYKSYCATIARTFMIDAPKSQQQNYNLLVQVRDLVMNKLKAVGTKLCDIYDAALELVADKSPELKPYFLPTCGYGIGLEPKEDYLAISATNQVTVQPGMCFVICVGFQNVIDENAKTEKRKKYSLIIADTVRVVAADNVELCTIDCAYDYESVSYRLDDDEEEEEDDEVVAIDAPPVEAGEKRKTLRDKKSGEKNHEDDRKRHQAEILLKKREEYLKRKDSGKTSSSGVDTLSMEDKLANKDLVCYPSAKQFPPAVKKSQIVLDETKDSILLPINGTHVPFHVASIKNVSKSDEGEFTVLRINFKSAGVSFGKQYAPAKQFPDKTFIKEVSYRAKDPKNLLHVAHVINDMRKKVTQKERDANERRAIVRQEPLKITKGVPIPRLRDVYIRPNPKGKKTVGNLEAHQNGIRFTSNKGENIDILYANVQHAFYQAAHKDTIVLLHFHLVNPIMIGKKSHLDVQFYTEVMEEYDHLVGARSRRAMTDAEAIEEENRERQLKQKLNKEFHNFATRVQELTSSSVELEFDIPYRELEFYGTPNRSNVILSPTVYCLVNLTDTPFFVLALEEVELAYFERVKYGNKSFDLVFVMKDYNKAVVHINSIPIEKIENIKDWLTSVEIPYFWGAGNLVWPKIMKSIRESKTWDPWGEGGWQDLDLDKEEEEEGGEDEEMLIEGNEEYAPDDEHDTEAGGDDEEFADEDEEDEDEYEGEEEEEDDGLSWDEMEKEAEEADLKRAYSEDEDDEQPARKKQRTK